ncbi:LysM peptidoglycan-binding domain-containing protein [uncultured Methylobacterium sp.]|uniref:LysM peptidoglycan-binding domain-containing protein n=1 Tax=uncultured Methylobacterium sp. TaxID=157278 RepID=UPI0035CC6324
MTAELRRGLALMVLGLLLGLGLVAALFGGAILRPAGVPSAPAGGQAGLGAPSPGAGAPAPTPDPGRQAQAAPPGGTLPADAAASIEPGAPTFDLVRVEPNGEAVVAGRGAPNAVVEMLVDGRAVARARADANGQFALVPPALPVGSSEIVLRATTADGRATRSRESVAVAVSRTRDAKPLVALTAPDRPTVVLSQPEPAAAPMAKGAATAARDGAKGAAKDTAKGAAKSAAPVTIVSVDAQEGGRLFVTGRAPPGASVRLYLNDTLIAPGRAGSDGTVTFTIGSGVKAGAYRVRVDQVEAGSGKVRGRAEVPFAVPEPVAVAAKPTGRDAAFLAPPAALPSLDGRAVPVAPAGSPTPAAVEPAAGGVFVAAVTTARISRGESLWQISRRLYGRGDRYTVIYDANQQQIRNPDLIYPGQLFILPGEDAKAGLKAGGRG